MFAQAEAQYHGGNCCEPLGREEIVHFLTQAANDELFKNKKKPIISKKNDTTFIFHGFYRYFCYIFMYSYEIIFFHLYEAQPYTILR